MNAMILVSALIFFTLGLALILLIRLISSTAQVLPVTTQWLSELSPDRYRPMLRLLDEQDFRFIQSHSGFTPGMAAKLRAQRCQIFRSYLSALDSDFKRTCFALKLVMVHSQEDRPDLASVLLHRRVTFACAMLNIRFRLILCRWGLCTVDVSGLVRMFDGVRLELQKLVPSSLPAAA